MSVANVAYLRRVETDSGFVQHHHCGIVDDGLSDADALLVAFGQRADEFFAAILQTAALFGQCQCRGKFCGRYVVQACGEQQKVVDAHVAIQRRVFRQEPDAGFGLLRLIQHVETAHLNLSALRRQCASEHLQGSAFACAVVSQQSQHLAAPQFQRHIVHHQTIVAVAHQILCRKGDGCTHWTVAVFKSCVLAEYNPIFGVTPKQCVE